MLDLSHTTGTYFPFASRGGTVRVSVSSRALFVLVTRMVAMGSKLSIL